MNLHCMFCCCSLKLFQLETEPDFKLENIFLPQCSLGRYIPKVCPTCEIGHVLPSSLLSSEVFCKLGTERQGCETNILVKNLTSPLFFLPSFFFAVHTCLAWSLPLATFLQNSWWKILFCQTVWNYLSYIKYMLCIDMTISKVWIPFEQNLYLDEGSSGEGLVSPSVAASTLAEVPHLTSLISHLCK